MPNKLPKTFTHNTITSSSMVTKFFLRLNTLPVTITLSPPHSPLFSLSKLTTTTLSLHSTTPATATTTHSFDPTKTQNPRPYGPSLQKGRNPSQYPPQFSIKLPNRHKEELEQEGESSGDVSIDEEEFTRVYDISALRVPAKDCYALESRLRGHLLNWPRVRNIARVPGDEMEEEVVSMFGKKCENGSAEGEGDEESSRIDSLKRRIHGRAEGDGEELSDVLYRERLGKEFNVRGFVRFRNLARISRPKKRKRKEGKGEEGEREGNGRKGRDEFATVEVMEEEEEEWKGLLGDEFEGKRKWRGATRLLLLDERYADKGVEELPTAVKVDNFKFI